MTRSWRSLYLKLSLYQLHKFLKHKHKNNTGPGIFALLEYIKKLQDSFFPLWILRYKFLVPPVMFWNGLLTVILSTQNLPIPPPTTYVTSTVKSLSSAHSYVVWFPRAKAKYQGCMKCRNFLSHSSRRIVLKLFLTILPTTDRGNKVKEDTIV